MRGKQIKLAYKHLVLRQVTFGKTFEYNCHPILIGVGFTFKG